MIDYYKKFIFNKEPQEYIYEYCLDDFLSLRRIVRQQVDIEKGSIWTLLPAYVGPQSARLFNIAVLPEQIEAQEIVRREDSTVERWVPTSNMIPMLDEYIANYLRGGDEHVCVFEDILTKPEDWLNITPAYVGYFIAAYSKEIYPLLFSEDANNLERIHKTVRSCPNAYQFFCLFTKVSREVQNSLKASQILNKEVLTGFVQNMVEMVFGAYDGDGCLFWTVNSTSKGTIGGRPSTP